MKSTLIFTLLLLSTSLKSISQTTTSPESIHDSLAVLIKAGGYIGAVQNPPTKEEVRLWNISEMIFDLPFSEQKKLITDSKGIVKLYGFTAMIKVNFDSVTAKELSILEDTTKAIIYTRNGNIKPGLTVGEICKMAYTSVLRERENIANEKKVKKLVESFIKTNSKHPNSYEPQEFTNYTWGGSEHEHYYMIQHAYKLNQIDGTNSLVKHYFILDHDFEINIIELNRSKSIHSNPPEVKEWLLKFGKNKQD